jgi:hypothetical protein
MATLETIVPQSADYEHGMPWSVRRVDDAKERDQCSVSSVLLKLQIHAWVLTGPLNAAGIDWCEHHETPSHDIEMPRQTLRHLDSLHIGGAKNHEQDCPGA